MPKLSNTHHQEHGKDSRKNETFSHSIHLHSNSDKCKYKYKKKLILDNLVLEKAQSYLYIFPYSRMHNFHSIFISIHRLVARGKEFNLLEFTTDLLIETECKAWPQNATAHET